VPAARLSLGAIINEPLSPERIFSMPVSVTSKPSALFGFTIYDILNTEVSVPTVPVVLSKSDSFTTRQFVTVPSPVTFTLRVFVWVEEPVS